MEKIIINDDYRDIENSNIEIVERKGLGHPDTLADKLAEECSRVYSKYCLDNFGCVLHHNFDKLYIGAGCFRYDGVKVNKLSPVKVYLNGRASKNFGSKKINLDKLLTPVIKSYLQSVLPRLEDEDLEIHINCTQNTKVENWFSPRTIDDVPDSKELFANDTSLCVAHYPKTYCEELALLVEQFFWNFKTNFATPKFDDVGQDIKVMVSRLNNDITLTICIPVYCDKFSNKKEYCLILNKYEKLISKYIESIPNPKEYNIDLQINKMDNGDYLYYSLAKGSCIECGEEGIVGRGNNSQGIIPSLRSHTMESPFGKNERYHTGRVLSFLADKTVKKIYEECGIKTSIYCLTKNKNNLLKPYLMYLSIDKKVDSKIKSKILDIVNEEFDESTYLFKILEEHRLV